MTTPIRQWRKELGYTQAELAAALGAGQRMVVEAEANAKAGKEPRRIYALAVKCLLLERAMERVGLKIGGE